LPKPIAPELLLCIMQRKHAMVSFVPAQNGYRGPGWGRTIHLRCVNCATERHFTLDSLGDIAHQRYVYTRDYRVALNNAFEVSTGDRRLAFASAYGKAIKEQARRRRRKTA
jgi:hypothetical protein